MKKKELVYREILLYAMEKRRQKITQLELAKGMGISLSTVNNAIAPLRKMGAVNVRPRDFEVMDEKKILYYWASIRNLENDIVYRTRVAGPVYRIESSMPTGALFGGYSAYKFRFKDVPADYSEVYVYADDLKEVKKRFPENRNPPNLFVIKKQFTHMTLANMFVDLWNMREWYAKEFLKALEKKLWD